MMYFQWNVFVCLPIALILYQNANDSSYWVATVTQVWEVVGNERAPAAWTCWAVPDDLTLVMPWSKRSLKLSYQAAFSSPGDKSSLWSREDLKAYRFREEVKMTDASVAQQHSQEYILAQITDRYACMGYALCPQ